MTAPSGLSLFFGTDFLIASLAGEMDGRLYGGYTGDYIYKASQVYRVGGGSGVESIYGGYAGGITDVYASGVDSIVTLIGTPRYPTQRFYKKVSTSGWTSVPVAPSGICNYLLSDDGYEPLVPELLIPVLTGNTSYIGNRIDAIVDLATSHDSDTGIPQVTDLALITDLEAAA